MINIFAVILIILSIGGFNYFILPTYDGILDRQEKIESYETALDKIEKASVQIQDLDAKYKALPTDSLASLGKMIPTSPDNLHLVADINAAASKYGSAIKNVNVEPSPVGGDSLSVPTTVSFSVTLSYNELGMFIEDLQNSLRIMDISSISFSVSETGSSVYTYQISLIVYSTK